MSTFTFTPPDEEFAAASGDNVNADPNWSYFDHPPNSTSNLSITSNEGDADPRLFEVGETYDLAWQGHGGGAMEDAVVLRSDYLGPGEGAIVFEGINSNTGELYQVVWSPNFDLEAWYWDNGGGPSSPNAFYTTDRSADDFQYACFAFGSVIDTPNGPRRIETLDVGDQVSTLDHGPVSITWLYIGDQTLEKSEEDERPVLIGAGSLGKNRPQKDLIVSPQHRILVGGSGQFEDAFENECFVPAKALIACPGIRHMSGKRNIRWVHVVCLNHEIVQVNGSWSESMLLTEYSLSMIEDGTRDALTTVLGDSLREDGALNGPIARPCLTKRGTAEQLYKGRRARLDRKNIRPKKIKPPDCPAF
ncbi:Hint domain-containing protein [uncultured Litoreibacter sp.]|uniref:Hint domain-containing protein n=1 Tax=uncultured Litoreibacter sp. TaxID=1392394 RepID=UPI002626A965|nr:Hint domain-containing protein [uncultured Litoreibacter sp.]